MGVQWYQLWGYFIPRLAINELMSKD
jgi:hypothetical protein